MGGEAQWISVRRKPESGRIAILALRCGCCGASWVCSGFYDKDRGGWNPDGPGWDEGMERWKVTHWMPTPKAPVYTKKQGADDGR